MKNKIKWAIICWLTLFLLISATTGTTFARGNWWDKFGEPKYGGTLTFAVSGIMAVNFDVYNFIGSDNNFFYEAMFEPDWTLDRKIYGMTTNFIPDQYWKGQLAETWEMPDAKTIVVHIRKGIRWQNKPPVNGREFTAYDVQSHYDRILGTGGGYTWRAPMYMGMAGNIERVTAKDKYTVVYKFKKASALSFQTIADRISMNVIEAPEWVALGGKPTPPPPPKDEPGGPPAGGGPPPPPDFGHGPRQDWTKVVGTGAWMLEKFVAGSSFIYAKNPDYWSTDPRYPKNKLPYADKLMMIVIPDFSTRMAALRTGKIDLMGNGPGGAVDWKQAMMLNKTNPEIMMGKYPAGASGIGIRVDKAPFTNIRVRKALNMAIDRKTMARTLFGGTTEGNPTGMITQEYKGYAFDYKDWPKSLKNEYTYNPKGAKKLLAQAGFPKGFKTNVVTSNDAVALEIIQAFKSYFKNIGVDMEIKAMDNIANQAFTRAGKHDQLSGQGGGATFPPNRCLDNFYSKGGSDAIYYGLVSAPDTTYDKLREDFINATDPVKAANIFQQLDRRVIEQHYLVTPCETYAYMIWQPYLKGYSGESLFWGQGVMWSRLWIDKGSK